MNPELKTQPEFTSYLPDCYLKDILEGRVLTAYAWLWVLSLVEAWLIALYILAPQTPKGEILSLAQRDIANLIVMAVWGVLAVGMIYFYRSADTRLSRVSFGIKIRLKTGLPFALIAFAIANFAMIFISRHYNLIPFYFQLTPTWVLLDLFCLQMAAYMLFDQYKTSHPVEINPVKLEKIFLVVLLIWMCGITLLYWWNNGNGPSVVGDVITWLNTISSAMKAFFTAPAY